MQATTNGTSSDNQTTKGAMGQAYLAKGDRVAMRLWEAKEPTRDKTPRTRTYETVGYVLDGAATLNLGGVKRSLKKGDSWIVPANTEHTYEIEQSFSAIEATSPPAREAGDSPVD